MVYFYLSISRIFENRETAGNCGDASDCSSANASGKALRASSFQVNLSRAFSSPLLGRFMGRDSMSGFDRNGIEHRVWFADV